MKLNYSAMTALTMICALGIGAGAATRTDAQISSAVRKSFTYRHYLKNDDIKIQAKDGVVVLTGSVSEEYHKTLAVETASAQTGVASVDDRLEVKAGGPAAGSDAWLMAKVKAMLLFHRSVSAIDTSIDAKDGVITLIGQAKSQAQKDLTAEYARDVEGVKDVRNQLVVMSSKAPRRLEEKIDDASITSEVKLTLLFHRSTSALNTGVKTSNGVVTLTGKASSTAAMDLAEKIVGDVRGVKSVKVDMQTP